ncbi:MAG: InlB B-repeat-containing protein, partial [Oscillospiraceae bacterium]|nr:InlB B-repeat-containing protein [Oscillospiraceae bacterium]
MQKRVLSIMLTLAMCLGLLALAPVTAHAAGTDPVTIDVSTLTVATNNSANAAESQWSYNSGQQLVLKTEGGNYTLTGTNAYLNVLPYAANENLTLSGVDITCANRGALELVAAGDGCTITLVGDNVLRMTGTGSSPAIGSSEICNFTITGNGSLMAVGGGNYALYVAATCRITGNAVVAAYGGSGKPGLYQAGGGSVLIGYNASLTIINNYSFSETYTFGRADAVVPHRWKLTNATTADPLTNDSITVTVASGQTGKVEREPVPTYAVAYSLNSGGGTAPTETAKPAGMTFTAAPAAGLTAPAGKRFKQWNTSADGSGTAYAPGATVIMPSNALTLYAVWEDVGTGGGGDSGDYFKLWGKTTTYLKSNFWNWILL